MRSGVNLSNESDQVQGVFDIPMYTIAMAARLVDLAPGRVRRWVMGYHYTRALGSREPGRERHLRPVFSRQGSSSSNYVSFIDLIHLLFVREFLKHGLSLQKIRKALDEVLEIIGEQHFAQRIFFTDGKAIYLQVRAAARDEDRAIIQLLAGGQWVIPGIITQLSHQIDFNRDSGFAERWFPLGKGNPVVIDPSISFGQPSVVGHGMTTANVYDIFIGEDKKIEPVIDWTGLNETQIEAAINFEQQLIAA